MSNDANKDVILCWFDVVNQGDIPKLEMLADEQFTADFIEHDPRMPDFEPGPAGVKNFINKVLLENTNVHLTMHDIFTSDDRTAYRFTVSMTDSASQIPMHMQLLAITRFVGGRIAEEWQLSSQGKW